MAPPRFGVALDKRAKARIFLNETIVSSKCRTMCICLGVVSSICNPNPTNPAESGFQEDAMSADNQVVILAHRHAFHESSWRYAAMVVGRPFDLQNADFAFGYAHMLARGKHFWFEGSGASGRARQMARLLAEEYHANGWVLEYENILFVEVSEADGIVWNLALPRS